MGLDTAVVDKKHIHRERRNGYNQKDPPPNISLVYHLFSYFKHRSWSLVSGLNNNSSHEGHFRCMYYCILPTVRLLQSRRHPANRAPRARLARRVLSSKFLSGQQNLFGVLAAQQWIAPSRSHSHGIPPRFPPWLRAFGAFLDEEEGSHCYRRWTLGDM